ncbi:Oidioi.mRNA.OKI2018_I69.XSR.g13792.t2.cds [Oikopleura dioica]|uniref:Oidioi.mRNA.OKI2018_I69.XSR.g13792.t2.cds n=1 Tax=Oikopleura dioica TaxID=34765 RepID=A0ABN7SCM7_OIKDI|nr:Oidioi.mRNA.OKI2018_I69.XSR.g13792.t2.cds [Oikopleura dioica]
MSGRSESRSETPSEKAPEKPQETEKMTLPEESSAPPTSGTQAAPEAAKKETPIEPSLAPKIPALQPGWPEGPVSTPSNPNWSSQPTTQQNPATSQSVGPNWDVHVDQSKAWDSDDKGKAPPAAPGQNPWPTTSASPGTDVWNPSRPNNSAQWGPPPQATQQHPQQSLPTSWPQHPSSQPTNSTPTQSLPSSMPSTIGNTSQIPPNPANPNWGPPSQHPSQQKSQQPAQNPSGSSAQNWGPGPSTPSQTGENRSGPWGPGSSGDAPATSVPQSAAPPSWNTPGSTPSTSQPQTPNWGAQGEPRGSSSSWGTTDISHLSEEQQKLINNNEGWGKRPISQSTKWEISESSQHDSRPRLPSQATGTELWDPKGPVHMNQREQPSGRNPMWPHAPSGPGEPRESSWPSSHNHPGSGMRYPSDHWPRDPVAHQPVQRPPWPSQNPYDSDWPQNRSQHNNDPSPWDPPPRPSYPNPGGRGGYGGGRDWQHHDKRPNENISGWPGDSRRPNPGMPNYINISNALKYNLLPGNIRSQMQMCSKDTLEQLDRLCQMLLSEWGKRESLASNMNQTNFTSYQQRQQIEQMINHHSSNEQKHRSDIMSLLNPGFGGGHRGGHPGSRPFPHMPDPASSFPQEPIWGLPKETPKPHDLDPDMPPIGGLNLNTPKQSDVVIPPAFVPGQRWEGAKPQMELERNKPIGEYQQSIPAIFKNTPSRESKWSDSATSDSPSWGNSNMREIWRGGPRGGSGGHWANHPDSNQTWGPHE